MTLARPKSTLVGLLWKNFELKLWIKCFIFLFLCVWERSLKMLRSVEWFINHYSYSHSFNNYSFCLLKIYIQLLSRPPPPSFIYVSNSEDLTYLFEQNFHFTFSSETFRMVDREIQAFIQAGGKKKARFLSMPLKKKVTKMFFLALFCRKESKIFLKFCSNEYKTSASSY